MSTHISKFYKIVYHSPVTSSGVSVSSINKCVETGVRLFEYYL